MGRKAVLFDFDGVIADTEAENMKYMEKALSYYGLSMSQKQKKALIGTDGRALVKEILCENDATISVDEFFAYRRKLGSYYEDSPEIKTISGLSKFLCSLRKSQVMTGVVSSTSSRSILIALNRLGLMSSFDTIVCGDMVTRKKPDPQGYQIAMSYLKISSEQTLILEDSPVGISAARASGARVIGFEGSSIQQDTSGANHIWKSYAQAQNEIGKELNML